MAMVDMSDMDRKIAAMNRRLQERDADPQRRPQAQAPAIEDLPPYNRAMAEGFKDWTSNIKHSARCPSCKWQCTVVKSKPLVITLNVFVMKENLVVPFVICKGCGIMFMPGFAKKIVNQACKAEEDLMVMAKGDEDGT